MSLRDALLKSGAVSKKKVQRVERELAQDRRRDQGSKKKKKDLLAEQRAAEAEEKAARSAEELAARRARRDAQEAEARLHRARQLIQHHGLASVPGGPVRFHCRGLRGELHRFNIPWNLAYALRDGRMAIAALTHAYSDEVEHLLLPGHVAEQVAQNAPEAIVYRNEAPLDADDPELRFIDEDCPRGGWDGEAPWRWYTPALAARWPEMQGS